MLRRRFRLLGCVVALAGPAGGAGAASYDFDGNGTDDVVVRNKQTVEFRLLLMDGATVEDELPLALPPFSADKKWTLAASCDLDGDDDPDLVFQHPKTGEVAAAIMDGTAVAAIESIAFLSNRKWKLVGCGDFDDDGDEDLVWWHEKQKLQEIWLMDGSEIDAIVALPPAPGSNYALVGVADFDDDGAPDLLWQLTKNKHELVLWIMDGTDVDAQAVILDLGIYVRACGPFDCDTVRVGYESVTAVSDGNVFTVSSGFNPPFATVHTLSGPAHPFEGDELWFWDYPGKPVSFADFDGGGFADVLWQGGSGGTFYFQPAGSFLVYVVPLEDKFQVISP